MIYYEFNFKRFYFPFQKTENGWVFGFIRKVIEEDFKTQKYDRFIDDILKDIQDVQTFPNEDIEKEIT